MRKKGMSRRSHAPSYALSRALPSTIPDSDLSKSDNISDVS